MCRQSGTPAVVARVARSPDYTEQAEELLIGLPGEYGLLADCKMCRAIYREAPSLEGSPYRGTRQRLKGCS